MRTRSVQLNSMQLQERVASFLGHMDDEEAHGAPVEDGGEDGVRGDGSIAQGGGADGHLLQADASAAEEGAPNATPSCGAPARPSPFATERMSTKTLDKYVDGFLSMNGCFEGEEGEGGGGASLTQASSPTKMDRLSTKTLDKYVDSFLTSD